MKNKEKLSRREFLNRSALGIAAVSLTPFTSILGTDSVSAWKGDASKYKFRMIGHGHIDPVWLWRWTEGVSVVHSTFRSALDRMKENPGMVFTCSSAQFYKWVAENDPEMLREVRQRIKEGRWEVVGGWWVEPDVNMPSGEAMVRQGLYGQMTLEKLVGKRATVAYNPDSFGHAGTMPQILKKQGLDNYVFMRPGPHEKDIPSDLFWWESADGSRVLAYRIQDSYNDDNQVRSRIESILNKAPKQPMQSFMAFYGVGDHGGGPTKANLKSIEELKKEDGAPLIVYGRTNDYFDEARKDKSLKLPVVKDDLQHHAVGCYTADWVIKKGNRHSEDALVSTEKLCAVGGRVWGVNYPKSLFTESWERLLFFQFHDSLAGSSLASHTKDASDCYGRILDTANEVATMAIQKLEWQIPSEDPGSEYLVIFNPHAWEITTNIHYDFGWWGKPETTLVTDELENSIPHQWVIGESQCGNRQGLVATVTLPPMGYRQIRIRKGESYKVTRPATAEGNTLENEFYKVTVFSDGSIGIFDKEVGKDIFSGRGKGCKAVVIDDKSDAWSHDIKTFDDEIGYFRNANIKVLENGPVRASIRVISYWGDSTLTMDWSLTSGSRDINAQVVLDWHERLKMLKFSFPMALSSSVSTYEAPYGSIVRETNGYENPGQRWIDLSGSLGGRTYGLAVLNDAKYGYDVKDTDMRISIARSAVYAHHNPKKLDLENEYYWMDQGRQTFRMTLLPHKGDWREANVPRKAEEFLSRPVMIYQGIHPGKLSKSASFLNIDVPNVNITSIKEAEKGDDLIIRCVETLGRATSAKINFTYDNFEWKGDFIPNEIKTLRYSPKRKSIKEVNLLEE